MTMAHRSNGESSLTKHLRVLESFDALHPYLTLAEIERASGLPHATAHRLVGELVREGLLERLSSGDFRLGMRLWEFASRTPGGLGLRELARPWMETVQARVRQHTQLGVLKGRDVLFVERMSTRDAVINVTLIGGRLPAPLSSSGIVLLAHATDEIVDGVVAAGWERSTANAIQSGDELRALLRKVRADRFVVLEGHIHADARGIAVPILGPHGEAYAALGVVGPNDGSPAQPIVELLTVAAAGIRRAIEDAHLPDGGATGRMEPRALAPLISTSRATLEYFASLGVGPTPNA